MAAPSDTTLKTTVKVSVATQYKRTDVALNTQNLQDNLNVKLGFLMNNGAGKDKANLQWYSTRRLINTTEQLDLDGGITDNFGFTINFDAVKYMLIRNLETAVNRYLEVAFKNERYYIGPSGLRAIYEPFHGGIEAINSSASAEEGNMTISSNADITYDIILIGSHAESSSDSGA